MFFRTINCIGMLAVSVTSILATEQLWKPIDTFQVESAAAYSDSKGLVLRKDCGPIAAFCVLMWSNMPQKMDHIFAHFPDISEKGVSLGDLSNFFESLDFYTEVETFSFHSLVEKSKWIGILYLPGRGQELGHFVASRVIEGKLQILDGTKPRFLEESGSVSILTLQVSREPIKIGWWKRLVESSIGLYLGLSCFALVVALKHHRVNKILPAANLFALLSLSCVLFSQCSPKRQAGSGQVQVDNVHYDAGVISLSSERMSIRHVFHVINTSSTPLRVKDHASSCTCGKLRPFTDAIGPGDEGDIEATMDLSIYRMGKVPVEFLVKFDNPDISPLRLTILATVTSNTLVTPTIVEFGEILSGESIEIPITIWTAESSLRGGKFPLPLIKAKLEGQSALITAHLINGRLDPVQVPEFQRSPIRYTLLIKAGLAKGEVKSNFLIQWPGEKGMEFAIPIFGHVVSNVTISPAVAFALPAEDGELNAVSFVNAHGGVYLDKAPEVVDFHSDLKVFKISPTTDKQWKIEWKLRPQNLDLAKNLHYSYTIQTTNNFSIKGEIILP